MARRRDRLDELASTIRAAAGTAIVVPADVTQQRQAQDAVEQAVADLGRLDTLVNNAGVMLLGPSLDASTEEWDRMVALNVQGLLYVTHAALPHLVRAAEDSPRRVADLVTISSTAGRVARPGSSVYNLTKFGVTAFTEALRQEMVPRGVRVSVVEPGTVDTELVSHLREDVQRPVVATAVAGAVLIMVAGALMPGRTAETPLPIDNPFALAGTAGTAARVLSYLGVALNTISYPAALVSLLLRFRASHGVERQQLRWVAAGAAVAVAGLLLGAASSGVTYLAVLCVPVAVAVLRYRLWDLDRLVSRTVTYALVTGLLVLPYLLILPVTTRLAGGSGSLAVAALTLAAAVAFAPLRRRVQGRVDRRFNRRRYDATRTLDAFAVRLREQVDLDALAGELLAVVDQTVQPTRASLWLRPPASARPQRQ